MKLTPGLKQSIDEMPLEEMLRINRFTESGPEPNVFQGESGPYFLEVMGRKRDADPGEWVSASKRIGWER